MVRINPECRFCGRCFLAEHILDHITDFHGFPLEWAWYHENERGEPTYYIERPVGVKS